jgi:hypothetical protein
VHVAAVYDKNVGTGQVRYYANGVKIGEENIDLSGGLNGNFASYIGSSGATVLEQYTRVSQGDGKNFNNYTMNFNIQDFVLKAGTTTDAQITSMVNAAVGTFTAPNLSFTTGSADGEINYSWTAPAVATVKLYIDEGTKTAAQLKATAPQLITTGALTIPGVFTGTSGASYSALVTASWGTNETESSVVTTVAGVNPNPVLRFETGANDGEISYRWSAGTGKTGHKLWVIIGAPQGATDVEKAVYIKTNGWMIREANTAEETAGVPSTTVKGNPGLIYSAALEALDGGTPIYSMVSNVAAKGTLSATTNIAPLYASLSGQGGVNGTLPFTNGVDGDVDSRYASSSGTFSSSNPKGITLTFGLPVQADSGAFNDWLQSTSAGGRTREFKIQYTDRAGNWQDAYWFNMPNNTNDPVGSTGGDPTKENSVLPIEFYQTVQSTQFRLHLYRAASNDPCFWEWRMYNAGLATTEGTNIAPKATVTASSSHSASYPAASAVDNNAGSRWAITSADWNDDDECWLQLEYTTDQTVNKAAIRSFATRITNFKIQYDNGGVWVDAYEYSGTAIPGYTTTSNTTNPVSAIMWAGTVVKNAYSFTPVTSRKFRLFITGDHTVTSSDPSIWEFYLYSPN